MLVRELFHKAVMSKNRATLGLLTITLALSGCAEADAGAVDTPRAPAPTTAPAAGEAPSRSFPPAGYAWVIMGADTAAGILSWDRYEPVLERADIAVYPRPGTTREAVEVALVDADFVWLDAAELDIEATDLREHARANGSLRFLVRDAVWRYIQRHEVYLP